MNRIVIVSLGVFLTLLCNTLFAQTGIIKGRVFNAINNEGIPFSTVQLQGTTQGVTTDSVGNYQITDLKPGLYNVKVTSIGFKEETFYEVQVTNGQPAMVNASLQQEDKKIETVEIKSSSFKRTMESPVSVRSIGVNEIQRNPGGNRDISKAIQSLPGVSGSTSFRNDLVVRGGAPNENRFYLDGIEVPNINHFATQGSSGGPVGMINVDFIKDVDFYSGAFPANRGNTLSSILDFKQIDGRDDRVGFTATIGASEVALSLQGPITKKSTFIVSFRQSYLQFLFKALQLPFLPTYNDWQFKNVIKINDKNDLTLLGLAALDRFALNLAQNKTEEQRYILGNLPENSQWNYTVGAKYRHYFESSYLSVIASRNQLNNRAYKYRDNNESDPSALYFDYHSQEIENKLRIEHTINKVGFKLNYGVSYEYATYTNITKNQVSVPSTGVTEINYSTKLNMNKYGFFAQVSKAYFKNRVETSFGLRGDGNDYSSKMANPFTQLSPRASVSVGITEAIRLNFNAGLYYQLPPYTTLGYKDSTGSLVNKQNGLTYINNKHLVIGAEYNTTKNSRITVESFLKLYDKYPFLLDKKVSLANLGGDFGVIGDDPATSTSVGRSYGIEVMFQQKLYKGFYGIVSYTFVRSEFKDTSGKYVPSSWDNRHLLSLTGGKKFKKNWELGLKWRVYGASPYTPYDVAFSALKTVWDVNNQGVFDYTKANSLRGKPFHQLDVRVDKKWYFRKWTFNLYLDIQNIYAASQKNQDYLTVVRDANNKPVTDPNDASRYLLKTLSNTNGGIPIPSIGVVVGF